MNLLEIYIKEIHGVECVVQDENVFVEADLTVNCYGNEKRLKTTFSSMDEWERTRIQGYYLG